MNSKGFVSLFFISILPIIIAGGLCFYSILGLIQSDLVLKQECRQQSIVVMENISHEISRLLKLNNKATHLRTQYYSAVARLEAAVASLNPFAAAAAQADIERIQVQREVLDLEQKMIIFNANRTLLEMQKMIEGALTKKSKEQANSLKIFLNTNTQFKNNWPVTLALEPDSQEIAPNYKLKNNFEETQALVFRWQQHFIATSWMNRYLKINTKFDKSCGVTAAEVDGKWHAKLINAGRF